MSSSVTNDFYAPGMEVQLSAFNAEELFPYTTYSRNKPLFYVPNIRKRYLLVTNLQLVDMATHPFKLSMASVSDVHLMSDLAKVKYKKGEVVSLTFKGDKIVQYGMKDTDQCIDFIRAKMTENGIQSSLLTNRYKKNIATAQGLLDTIREIEGDFEKDPSYELVATVMELLRDAVELFGEANDSRYLRALAVIQNFLQRSDVALILDQMALDGKKRSGSERSSVDFVRNEDGGLSISTPPSMHLSLRLSKHVDQILKKSPKSSPCASRITSPINSDELDIKSSNEISLSSPIDDVVETEATQSNTSRRKISADSNVEINAGTRPRVTSRVRRRSIRTQSLENDQFMTMDSLHFDDVEDALWVEDEDTPMADKNDISGYYDFATDENIALLDSMIGNMTHELEDIIGESVNFDDTGPEWRNNGPTSSELGFTLTRGLSSVEVLDGSDIL